jgi:hypothetical protein
VGPEYFTEIEAHFARRRGTPFILSPKDFALMKEWAAEGVPLPLVIEALDAVFDKAAERGKVINGLSYCRHAVKELWKERKELRIGDAASAPEESPEALLASLADAVAPVDAATAEAIRGLTGSAKRIEERLIEIEGELIDRLIASTPPEELAELRREIAAALAGVDEKQRTRTEEANLRRMVRQKVGLPRLTLFG